MLNLLEMLQNSVGIAAKETLNRDSQTYLTSPVIVLWSFALHNAMFYKIHIIAPLVTEVDFSTGADSVDTPGGPVTLVCHVRRVEGWATSTGGHVTEWQGSNGHGQQQHRAD